MPDTTTQPAADIPGARSPVVYVRLCPPCGGYQPMTPEDYYGALSGRCQGCGSEHRETHRFPALIDSARECACTTSHQRVSGDLPAGADSERLRAAFRELTEAHRPDDEATPFCLECGYCWPCPTRRIINKVERLTADA